MSRARTGISYGFKVNVLEIPDPMCDSIGALLGRTSGPKLRFRSGLLGQGHSLRNCGFPDPATDFGL